ncbi:MAG: adenylosuccinate lyase [Exilispira sp.]|jgi:adenylosuccinate lyase|nr:adenylosuccinate lyase [Exilispira sp.]
MKDIQNNKISQAFAISPLDGRYYEQISFLSEFFSEYALIKSRIYVEILWFHFLLGKDSVIGIKADQNTHKRLDNYFEDFSIDEFLKFKQLESKLRHDVKPVEYLLKDIIDEEYREFLHFGLTSEDVTNIAYAINFKNYRERFLLSNIDELLKELKKIAISSKDIVILGHTHGQSATPSTFGKEIAYYIERISKSLKIIKGLPIEAKLNGAVGNFAALKVAYPELNWMNESAKFIESIGLKNSKVTKQIEPHDWICRICNELSILSSIIIDLCKDIWLYGLINYLKQKPKEGEIGSSTMPHKINPIDFENCWGNMEIVIAISQFFARKLPVTFLQRDLSDSTVLRNLGLIFGHFELGLSALKTGLSKIVFNRQYLEEELESHPEVLAEAVQTILRKNRIKDGYEILKEATRGKEIDYETLHKIIENSNINLNDKKRILKLKVKDYIGESTDITENICKENENFGKLKE